VLRSVADVHRRRRSAALRVKRQAKGEVVPFEHPDFLIKTHSRWVGIELTEYHVLEPDEGWGSPMRARA
jgi:hypothetical protein